MNMKEGQPVKMESGRRGSNVSFYADMGELEELEKIRWREHKSMSEIIRKAIQEYIKIHGEGNDSFKLDPFIEDSNFKAIPALLSPKEKWNKFIRENTSKEERSELDAQAKFIREVIDAKNWLDNRNK